MKLWVAGQDRCADLGECLRARARTREDPDLVRRVRGETATLALREAADTAAYLAAHIAALRSRNCVDVTEFAPPPAAGGRLARIKRALHSALWRFLRLHYEWLTFRQNTINMQLAYELEFERAEAERRAAALETRVAALEAALRGAGPPPGERP